MRIKASVDADGKEIAVTVPENELTMADVINDLDFSLFDAGGGLTVAGRTRKDGKYVVIGVDVVCVYASCSAFEDGESPEESIELY